MKKLLFLFAVLGLTAACTTKTSDNTANADSLAVDSAAHAEADAEAEVVLPDADATGPFGAAITTDGAITGAEVLKQLAKADSARIKVKGNIASCCQAKGCWMTMPLADKQEMMVKFKDYGFFVPRNSAGKEAVIEGWAYREVVSVEELRHYAEDEGLPKAEIEKITKPEERITFMADGVVIAPSAESAH